MPFPRTAGELKSAGWTWLGPGECRDCGQPIEWYQAPGNGRKVPFDPMDRGGAPARKHFDTCTG